MHARAPSYASAVANAISHNSSWGNLSKPSLESQVKELASPPPTSMTLTAVLHLLAPLDGHSDVYLMTRSYLQNWLIWAYNENVPKTETQRVQTAVRLAADQLGLTPPSFRSKYNDPGPVNNMSLSMEGSPLLLSPNVSVRDGTKNKITVDELLPRVRSLPNPSAPKNNLRDHYQNIDKSIDVEGNQILCCAVPEKFYEILRITIGVTCTKNGEVSFQPFLQGPLQRETEALIHHHHMPLTEEKEKKQKMTIGNSSLNSKMNGTLKMPSQPIEFRRKVITKAKKRRYTSGKQDESSPMTRLLKEEENHAAPELIPTVEVYPIKLVYTVIDGKNEGINRGFILVSQSSRVYDALQALMKVTAPNTSSTCKRVWSLRNNGTLSGDGFELIDLNLLDGNLTKSGDKDKEHQPRLPLLTVGEWLQTHSPEGDDTGEARVLVEVRRSNDRWARESLELEKRIQVGDFVDAQDGTGKWYEAIVKKVTDTTVTVHYFGWASRWNGQMRRSNHVEAPSAITKLQAPAPLWSHSKRWRERIVEGKVLEVRDASSRVDRPKWFKGVVKRIGLKSRKMKMVTGGAELEMVEDDDGNKMPLLLLNRVQQIMVQVEQEIDSSTSDNPTIDYSDDKSLDTLATLDTVKPQPPFLRWVDLYGEEVCEVGTHMKISSDGRDLGVATLQYEVESHRKPVEIMKSFNNMYGQGFMKESLRGTPPAPGSVGMHNLGNSCFINSIIQCLNHMEPLTQYFLEGTYANDLNRKNPLGSGGRVATAYSALLKEVWSGKYSALAPRMLKQTVASFAPQFNNSFQHDSQEFCQFLMDGLHEDCNRVKNKPYVEELEGLGMEDSKAAIETWKKHLLRHDSIIVDRCQGMHRSHLTCTKCGRESIKFDAFCTISLPLIADKGDQGMNIQDCIEKFLEGEQLDELNAWYCPSCKKHVCALKMIALWSVPDILILHLKRFTFDHCSVRNDVIRSKINDTVRFPIERLDLTKHVLGPIDEDAPPIYRLYGVSEHVGPTANSGHYTATVRNSKDDRWFRYNDAHVGETTADAAVTGGAYLLFYERAKGRARWGGMEKMIADNGGLHTDQDGFTTVTSKKKKHG